MDDPSNLPSFARLASDLANAARVPFDEESPIDLFLGSMPANFDVHAHTHAMVSPVDSKPNSTHKAIVRVASSMGAARIVTTNFDDHLTVAAASESVTISDRWVAPALPMGDAFTGVVHLHGSVLRTSSELVITDRDFGRAYLNDAWATRFLQKMFEQFTVLFIGYSVDDPIMRYLALGLPSHTKRYVLTHKPDDTKWSHLGIDPISYPGTDKNHTALLAALQAWDRQARMGSLDHRARMREIVDGGTALTPVDRDYVRQRLLTEEGASDFAQTAATIAWLKWAEALPEFRALFNGGAVGTPARILANWFGSFISDPKLHGAALQTVERLGQQFASVLMDAASWSAEHLSRADAQAGRRWKTLLSTSIRGHSAPPEIAFFGTYDVPDDAEPLEVIRVSLRPFLSLKMEPTFGSRESDSPPSAELTWQTSERDLSIRLAHIIRDAPAGDQVVAALLEDALNNAYDLLTGYHGEGRYDPLTARRSAIDPHRQDSHRSPADALIDALRDFGIKGMLTIPGLPERWWNQKRTIFRRLALHLLTADESKEPDEKIRWMLDRNVIYMHAEKHEVFRVLANSLPSASSAALAELLTAVQRGPDDPMRGPEREKHRAYSTYNLLAWLTQSKPDWQEAATEFETQQVANPNFEVRENPDFNRWSSTGSFGGRLPVDPDDFMRAAVSNLEAAFDDLVGRDYSERNFEEPSWSDALAVIRRVTEASPTLGIDIWDLVDDRDDLGDRAAQLKQAIIGGWELGQLKDEAFTVVMLVASELQGENSAWSISQFLLAQIEKHIENRDSSVTAALRDLARDLWSTHAQSFEHDPAYSPASLALNSWPGKVASFWASEVDRRWRQNREGWAGFNTEESAAILELLNGPPSTQNAVRPALASLVYFLFAADPVFVKAHILPLFANEESASQMWGSYLYHPRVDDRMLSAGLLDGIVHEWNRLDDIGDHGLPNQFYDLAASVVSLAGLTSTERQRVLEGAVLAADGRHAPSFASSVVSLLESPDVDGAEIWDSWLRDYFVARISGLPRNAEPEELARWADGVPFLGRRIPDAVDLLTGKRIGLGKQYNEPSFPEGALTTHGQKLVPHLAERIRNSSPTGGTQPHIVSELISSIRAVLGDAAQPIVDAATERGIISH